MTERDIIVVGAGQRGMEWCDAIDRHPRWRLAGVVDLDARARERARSTRPDVDVDEALRPLLDRVTAGAVLVATPHHHHAAPCNDALDAGAAVLVEKPFATSMAEAEALTDRAASLGLPLLVAQNYRHLRWVTATKAILDAGRLGKVESVWMDYRRPWEDLDDGRRTADHSVVWEMAPHHVDLLRHLLGDELAEVRATIANDPGRPPGATLAATARTMGGVPVRYRATYEEGGRLRRLEGGRRFRMRIAGSSATLHVLLRWLVLVPRRGVPSVVRRGERPTTEEAVLLDRLAAAVDGDVTASNARDNLRTLAGVIAMLESAERGAPVAPMELLGA